MKNKILIGMAFLFLVGSVFANESSINQNLKVTVLPDINIFSPLADSIYTSREVLINMTANGPEMIQYSDNGKRPYFTICRNGCEYVPYIKRKPFDDGKHELTFFATYNEFGIVLKTVGSFIVDTKKPIVSDSSPKTGFANGTFIVKFQEANPVNIILNYGNNIQGYEETSLDLNECKEEKLTKTCSVQVDLNDYNEQGMIYWFYVNDAANREGESRARNLKVDFSKPIIDSLTSIISDYRVTFIINVTEKNFDKIMILDNNENPFLKKPVWKTLCSKLIDGACVEKRNFIRGSHDVKIKVLDKAGNFEERSLSFEI